jgi:hypothetical protein
VLKIGLEPELTFCQLARLTVPLLQLLNPHRASLLMHCITAILTSLISQALLQVVLDKEPSDFIGSVFHYEFPKVTMKLQVQPPEEAESIDVT